MDSKTKTCATTRKKSENLSKIFVRSDTTGKLISLANLVEFEEVGSAKILARYDRQRAVTISARLVGDYTLSEALDFLETTVSKNTPEARIEWKGKSEELKKPVTNYLLYLRWLY